MSNKFEQLLELLINEENDKAEQLFHEIVVEKSRDIYEGLAETTEESKDETVEETKEETKDEETVGEQVELADESKDETVEEESIEEVGGDATDELIKDVSAEEEGDMEAGEEGEEEMEDRVVDLEDALDELKAEFEKMMSGMDKDGDGDHDMDDHEKEESLAPTEAEMPFEAMHDGKKKEKMDEYKIQKSADNADHADGKKSPVNDAGTKMGDGGKNIAQGSAEEKGRTAPTAETIIGDVANTAGKEKVSMKPAPKAVTADKADNKKSPVASK